MWKFPPPLSFSKFFSRKVLYAFVYSSHYTCVPDRDTVNVSAERCAMLLLCIRRTHVCPRSRQSKRFSRKVLYAFVYFVAHACVSDRDAVSVSAERCSICFRMLSCIRRTHVCPQSRHIIRGGVVSLSSLFVFGFRFFRRGGSAVTRESDPSPLFLFRFFFFFFLVSTPQIALDSRQMYEAAGLRRQLS